MPIAGYWQPLVRCKNPDCFYGTHTFLPFPDLPEIGESKPDWPEDSWKPFLICRHCGRGYRYSKKDVEWESGQNKGGLREHELMLYAELRCVGKACGLPVKVYLGSDVYQLIRSTNEKLEAGSRGALCDAGYGSAEPLDVMLLVAVEEFV